MGNRVEFGLPAASLAGANGPSARLAYSYWFIPLDNTGSNGRPVLTKTQFLYLAMAAGIEDGLEEMWEAWHGAAAGGDTDNAHAQLMLRARPPGPSAPLGEPSIANVDNHADFLTRSTTDVLSELTRSEIGMLFLDRTRIVPQGFVVGEHLYTLAMSPAEEVVLEQHSFNQSESVLETTDEHETNTEGETTDSWTTDNADTIVGSGSATSSDGFTAGGSVGFDYGVKVGVQGNYSNGTTSADSDSRTISTKGVHVSTTKAVAKMRDLHKTVFRLTSTSRFEESSRRTIRNPNRHTPIDLHMYKVLQRTRFSHERFGVRLCWTPFVKDPAGEFFAAEDQMRNDLLTQAANSVPPLVLPAQPSVTEVPGATVVGLNPPMVELNQWGGWPGSDMSHNYTLPINLPANMKWDGDSDFVKASLRSTLTGADRGFGVAPVGDPWEVVGPGGARTVFLVVHAGATWRLTGSSQLFVSLSARAIPDATSLTQEQAAATTKWESACAQAISDRAKLVAAAQAAAMITFEAWRDDHRRSMDPAQELIRRFVNAMFPADARDEIAELDLWEQVFDWSLASARTYSGTWNGNGQLREPQLPAGDFVNASWARLYLPVRPGFEELALRWILLHSRTGNAPACIADLLAEVTKDLNQWRIDNLGGPEEISINPVIGQSCPEVVQNYVCLGTWADDLPTDGVHMEVTQAMTSAADQLSADLATAELDQAMAIALSTTAGVGVRQAVAAAELSPLSVRVDIDEPGK